MSQVVSEHRASSPHSVRCVVITVSDTRTPETDGGGDLVVEHLLAAGHQIVSRHLIKDEPAPMRHLLEQNARVLEVDAILLTGGTGISSRDRTFETVSMLLTRQLPGYGELLRMLSFSEVGAAAMLTRAVGGVLGQTVVLTMPGSPNAVELAMQKLILPELGHLVREAHR